MAKKKSPETLPRPIRELLRRLIKAPAALSLLWPAMLLCLGYFGWYHWGNEHVTAKFTLIEENTINVTPQPRYIPGNIRGVVYKDNAVDRISLLDSSATTKLASAFSSNPWIRDVVSVRKLPGGQIDVHVNYREPVAMVKVMHPYQTDSGTPVWRPGHLPIDRFAVVLPPGDLYSQVNEYVEIRVPGANFNGNVGDTFENAGVMGAAAVAGLINEILDDVPIRAITAYGDSRGQGATQLELVTEDGTSIAWGSPPGEEQPGEQPAALKLHALLQSTAAGTDLRHAQRRTDRF